MAENQLSRPPNESLIEIRDPEIDAIAIQELVYERLRDRRSKEGYEQRQFPTFSSAGLPLEKDGPGLDPSLRHYLDLVNESYFDFETQPDVQLSPATRGRFWGRIWSLIRRQAHQLVLFYVNRSIEHQVAVNRQLVSIVNLLTSTLQEQQHEIATLRRELEEMRRGGEVE
jgi:hypothetical protein